MTHQPRHLLRKACASWLIAWMALSPLGTASAAPTALADAPIFATKKVPPNLLLDLSVEWPTGVVAAYNDNVDATAGYECSGRDGSPSSATNGFGVCYFENRTYLGLFDPQKCYDYVGTAGVDGTAPPAPSATSGYFTPTGYGSGASSHQCSNKWSGNYLNWVTMQAIDTFRWALTGGDRVIDTASKTIVEKARHSGQGGYNQFPVKRIRNSTFSANGVTVPGVNPSNVAVTPMSTSTLYARVHNGTQPFYNFYNSTWNGPQVQFDCNTSWNGSCLRTYYVRVEVCKPGLLEANCELYGSSWKPTGLIQQNADRMRFGVFGYLLDSVQARRGGVMRSKLKDVGPMTIDPINPSVANPRREWSSTDGTLVANPDTADASASSVTQSGVINYLNKFGKASDLYKSYDTISEMYYESLRYLRNMGAATPEYVSSVTAAMRDGFPVITAWDDPVQYSCQKNYVMMIADVNAWCDFALPGTSITSHSGCPGHTSTVSNPIPGLNVTSQTNAVAKLDNSGGWVSGGYGSLANVTANATTGRGNTWYLAGLAYWANTNNLRPDITKGTSDLVTAQTYMVDVAETGSWFVNDASNQRINQMWLAAKYGGFANVNLDGIPANQQTWDKNNDGIPDNYFLASRPDAMVTSLASVFNSVLALTESASGATLISSQVQNGDSIYEVQYSSDGWVGDVFGSTISFDALGNPTTAPSWSARPLLDTMVGGGGWNTTRKIATWNGTQGVPFRLASLTSAQQNALGGNAAIQQEVLNWLRGDRSLEGKPYRIRKGILGDIVSAEAVPVAFPLAPYGDGTNPGYSAFKTANAARQRMVYAASNDGMLHAFRGNTPGGGQELFAYVPSFGFNGPSVPATPGDNGLQALSQSTYQHRFYVDATPVAADVDFARVGVAPSLVPADTYDWRTILVGGLGKGGKGYYALDITNPTTMAASETALASKVLWEFTDPDMGYSYGKPVITKLRAYGWVVIVTSGINNTDGVAANKGKGFLYILNARTGQLIQKIGTGAGTAADPSGFAHIAGYSVSFTDATVDQIYGGDQLGNLWRFDLTSATGTYTAPTKIAQLTSNGTTPQPITSVPRIEQSLNGVTRWVFVGTGRLLDNSDMGNTQTQSMYAFKDGTISAPATAATLPAGLAFPLVRSNFAPLSDADLLTGITVGPTQIGWVHDLSGVGAASGTERVTFDPVANAGVVAWIGNIPSTNPCSPGVTSRSYAVNYETGKTTLVNIAGGSSLVPFTVDTYGLVKIQFIKVGDRVQLIASERTRKVVQVPSGSSGGSGPPRRVNWREIID
jgi:type IV pilus assembly protein PilY1